MTMKIFSSTFENNSLIPEKYTCDGVDVNPPLRFEAIPSETKSLVLIVDDPDAARPGGWVHWIVFNVDPGTKEIREGLEPKGEHGGGTGGDLGYKGPCPPDRQHRYFFKLYALNEKLNLSSGISKEDLERNIQNHIVEKAELVGLYGPKK